MAALSLLRMNINTLGLRSSNTLPRPVFAHLTPETAHSYPKPRFLTASLLALFTHRITFLTSASPPLNDWTPASPSHLIYRALPRQGFAKDVHNHHPSKLLVQSLSGLPQIQKVLGSSHRSHHKALTAPREALGNMPAKSSRVTKPTRTPAERGPRARISSGSAATATPSSAQRRGRGGIKTTPGGTRTAGASAGRGRGRGRGGIQREP